MQLNEDGALAIETGQHDRPADFPAFAGEQVDHAYEKLRDLIGMIIYKDKKGKKKRAKSAAEIKREKRVKEAAGVKVATTGSKKSKNNVRRASSFNHPKNPR